MVKLPEAIQRQVDEAEALERQLYAQEDNSNEQQVADSEPVVDPVQPEQTETPEPRTEEPAPRQERDEAAYWKARFDTVQGMISAQSAQFTEQLRASNEQVQSLRAKLAKVQQSPEPQAKDTDAETFGEDLVDAIDRRAKQMASSMVSTEMQPLLAYIKQLEGKLGVVGEQVATAAQDTFESQLARAVPDFEQINVDQGFLNWLGEVDPVYGVPRQAALDAAANSRSVDRVAAIFNAYKSLTSKQVQQTQSTETRKQLERQTAPTSSRGSAQQPVAGKVWTLAEYERALDPRNIQAMGRAAADDLVAEAERALNEGRVRF